MNTDQLEKTRYSDAELSEFDALLIEKLALAKEQLAFYQQQLEDHTIAEGGKMPSMDDGSVSFETDRLQTLATRQVTLMKHLENARQRVRNKVYGICRETGKLIAKERLIAVPHATLSIEAKQKKK